MNRYELDAAELRHFINDELRAVVPLASVAAYRESWPDAPEADQEADQEGGSHE